MALVKLRAPLSELAGGRGEQEVDAGTVGELLRTLEQRYPPVTGWILDERGRIREHLNVYVNGVRGAEETTLGPSDRVHVLNSISGG